MRKLLLANLLLLIAAASLAQERPDFRNEYYMRRRSLQESLPTQQGTIVMFGNSITEHGMWNEFFPNHKVLNRGIGGDKVYGMVHRMPYVADTKPKKIFIMTGINDLIFTSVTIDVFEKEYNELVQIVKDRSPRTKIYLQSILPVNDEVTGPNSNFFKDKNPKIEQFNEVVKRIAAKHNVQYINIHDSMLSNGKLNMDYSFDGIHLNEKGYLLWTSTLKKYINEK